MSCPPPNIRGMLSSPRYLIKNLLCVLIWGARQSNSLSKIYARVLKITKIGSGSIKKSKKIWQNKKYDYDKDTQEVKEWQNHLQHTIIYKTHCYLSTKDATPHCNSYFR